MSDAPRRAHVLEIKVGADTLTELVLTLRHFADDIDICGLSMNGCAGGPGAGYHYSYSHDPEQTHERYFAAIEEWKRTNA